MEDITNWGIKNEVGIMKQQHLKVFFILVLELKNQISKNVWSIEEVPLDMKSAKCFAQWLHTEHMQCMIVPFCEISNYCSKLLPHITTLRPGVAPTLEKNTDAH